MYRGGCSKGGGAISCSTENGVVNFEVSLTVLKVGVSQFEGPKTSGPTQNRTETET